MDIPPLKHLDLSGVDLQKEINWFELLSNSLPSLLELDLENCQIHNIKPAWKTNFTNLQVLDLSNNKFNHEIPSWFSNQSTTLVQLHLSGNFLHGEIPQIISNLQNLKSLDLQGNQLSGALAS
jgi:Leucine-rich repeat (LRR) protein